MSRNYLHLHHYYAHHPRLSDELASLAHFCQGKKLTFGDLVGRVEHRSHALLVLVVSLPFLLPMPLPGLSIPIGVLLMVVGLKKSLGHGPWLPRWLWRKKIPTENFVKVLEFAARFFRKVEKIIRPRGQRLFVNPVARILHGSMIACCGFFLSLPLPPGTNFPPALCAILLAIGVLERDIVFSVLGYLLFLGNIALFSTILFFGVEGIQLLSQYSEFMKKF